MGAPDGPSPAAVTLDDYRDRARTALPADVFAYIDAGAGDEVTCGWNRTDFDRIGFVPLTMRDVSAPTIGMRVLGRSFQLPLGVSPTAFQRLVHSGGELATARAAAGLGVPMIVSAMASVSLESVAGTGAELWLQTYLFKDRERTYDLVRRAEGAGYRAVVVSLGCPVPARRDRAIRAEFRLPGGVSAANFARADGADAGNPIHALAGAELEPSVTWRDVERLRERTRLPIVLKGLMHPLDVAPALDIGVEGILVSNHGGRQLDGTVSTIRILPEIAEAVAGRTPVFVDSGFRRGTDVLKALALGADGVFLGRPVLWALATAGEAGVRHALGILAEELRVAMQLLGCRTIEEVRRDAPRLLRLT